MQRNTKFFCSLTKVSGLAILLGTLPLLVGTTGCTTMGQTAEERQEDLDATSRVVAALGEDTQYKYGGVTASTLNGTVHLRGYVNSRDQKERAESLARKVEGVLDVKNDITVQESAK